MNAWPRREGFSTDRRRMLRSALGWSAAIGASGLARAQGAGGFPSQPVRVVVPFGPGGLADISMRLVAQKLTEKLGQQVVVENRPGAGGVVAASAVSTAPADGHTLILFSNGTSIAKTLIKLPYDPQSDFVPVSSMAYFDLNLLVRKDSPFADLRALLDEATRRPLTLGSINPGSTQHLSAELFRSVTKINATVIPFKTSSEVQLALQRGDIDLGFESYAALRAGIDSGLLRALITTGSKRTPWLPQVPTSLQAGLPGYEVTGWNAIYGPKGMSAAVIDALNRAVREVIAQPDTQQRLLALGIEPQTSTPAEMAEVFERDRAKWADVIRVANIRM